MQMECGQSVFLCWEWSVRLRRRKCRQRLYGKVPRLRRKCADLKAFVDFWQIKFEQWKIRSDFFDMKKSIMIFLTWKIEANFLNLKKSILIFLIWKIDTGFLIRKNRNEIFLPTSFLFLIPNLFWFYNKLFIPFQGPQKEDFSPKSTKI
jgi:hypothetical protein